MKILFPLYGLFPSPFCKLSPVILVPDLSRRICHAALGSHLFHRGADGGGTRLLRYRRGCCRSRQSAFLPFCGPVAHHAVRTRCQTPVKTVRRTIPAAQFSQWHGGHKMKGATLLGFFLVALGIIA